MRIRFFTLLTGMLLVLGVMLKLLTSAQSQVTQSQIIQPDTQPESQPESQPELCPDVAEVPASKTLRSLDLPQFGIELDIPENFQPWVEDDGSVVILDPGTFEVLSCVERGGRAIAPRGIYSLRITRLQNPEEQPLPAFIHQQGEIDRNSQPYNLEGIPVLLTRPEPGYTVRAWFMPPQSQAVVVLSESCDCELEYDDMRFWLQRIRLLPNP
ncbi:MAG: hypothetical protein Fur0046_16850 [Cyanobacteria bacterium J069]|nr:MAG: hypothetical protein D6742_14745 [Cyanobacteria bacterium J069]